jgi:hypothetical protein
MYVNAKITPIETIPGIGKEGVKGGRGDESKNDMFDTL